jgi:hypothetical protein
MEIFDDYEHAFQLGIFTGDRVYSLYETGISTVVQAPYVTAQLGTQRVGQAVLGE